MDTGLVVSIPSTKTRRRLRSLSQRLSLPAIALLSCLLVTPAAVAQEKLSGTPGVAATGTEPVVVVSIGSLNKLMQDINYVTGVVGQPQAGGMFSMFAGMFGQGLDMTKPIGVVVSLVDNAPLPMALLPTNDVKTTLKRLEAQVGPYDQLDDGTLVISVGSNTVFIRQMDGWAALAPQKDILSSAPSDPMKLMDGMGNNYDLAFRLKLQQVPADTRNALLAQIRQGFEGALQQQGAAEAEQTRQVAESSMEQLDQFINETDELSFGLNIDQSARQIVIDTAFAAVAGTELAAMYGGSKPIESNFASVIRDDAAMYYHSATSISPEAVQQTRKSVETSLSTLSGALENAEDLNEVQREDIKEVVDRVVDLTLESIGEGKLDAGVLLLADEGNFQFVFGTFVADGAEAAQIAKDVATKVEGETDAPRFTFDVGTHEGVTMHLIEADIPVDQDEVRRAFGDTLQVHVGTGDKSFYLATGKGSDDLMKELIDKRNVDTDEDRPIGQMKMKLLPILKFAYSVSENDTIAAMIDELSRSVDPGLVTAVQDSIVNGQKGTFTIGEGLLQAVGAAIRQTQQAKMQDQF